MSTPFKDSLKGDVSVLVIARGQFASSREILSLVDESWSKNLPEVTDWIVFHVVFWLY